MSNGPSGTEPCSSSIFLFIAGVTGAVFGLFASYLVGRGELWFEHGAWLLLIFLLVYTVSLLFLIFYLGSSPPTSSDENKVYFSLPKHPNRLQRLRSYLAFFPITHVINGEGGSKGFSDSLSSVVEEPIGLSVRVNAQMDMAIDAIVSEYVSPWHTKISDDNSFIHQVKDIIHTAFLHLGDKLRQVDRNELAKEAIQILHVHWKEYTDALRKAKDGGNEDELQKHFRFVHPFLQDSKEVSKRYQQLVSKVLKELGVPDLNSAVMCQFIGGILVKNFILFYVELMCQPSWVNGTLMSILSSGSMSVDITGSSSQNSSSPASPLPDQAKQTNLFGDEVINDCASLQSLTGDESSPTTKSIKSESQEEYVLQQRSLESNSSASVDEGTSSEPKTESSPGPSPVFKGFDEENKWSSSTSSSSMFPSEVLFPLTSRPKDLKPLKSSGTMRTVTTCLGKVMQATAFPLLPSECYSDESCQLSLTVSEMDGKISSSLMEYDIEPIGDEEEVELPTRDSVFEPPQEEEEDEGGNEKKEELEDETEEEKENPPSTKVSSHYYSFDEASKPKPTHGTFFETSTLSLDGAIEGRKQEKDQLQLCSHEYKQEGEEINIKPQRSPVYEEPEDFAASIAKLRSLLEQKERKSSTPPPLSVGLLEDGDVFESPSDSPAAGSSGGGGSGSLGGIPQISETCASETHTTPSSTSSMDISKGSRFSFNETILNHSESDSTSVDREEIESVPEIKCCFRNVSIPKVENSMDAGGQYIYYCIQYEGVYFDDYDTNPRKLVYRTTTIKRKFKEFLTLQAHLETNLACKPHLKGMKTPTRWLNVSLTKSDATVASQRRAMLEKYLQQLCYHPVIGFCQEILIFMAYGEDGFCSFEVGDPKDLLSHRLDKLAKKFTGVINSLKEALPTFELDLSPAPHTPKSEMITPSDLKDAAFPSFPFQEKYADEKSGEDLETSWETANWHNQDNPESLDNNLKTPNDLPPDLHAFPPSEADGVEPGKIFTVYPLAAAVTHLLCDVLWLPQYHPHPTSVATFMSISGKSLEHYVMETMDIFLSEEAILGYLEWLTISINTGQSETDSQRCDVNGDLFSEQDLKNIAKRRIPAWVRWMWGRNRLDLTIDRITGLFQSPLVNHDLVLSLSELLFSKMITLVDENDSE